jgi:hypothetical protein
MDEGERKAAAGSSMVVRVRIRRGIRDGRGDQASVMDAVNIGLA